MNQVLSQSEVDALLAAVSDGDVATSETPKEEANNGTARVVEDKKVVSYDLTSQDRIIRGRLPQLEVIYALRESRDADIAVAAAEDAWRRAALDLLAARGILPADAELRNYRNVHRPPGTP